MNEIPLLISAAALLITILGVIYSAGVQRQQLNTALAEISQLRQREEKLNRACAQVEIIWDALVKRGAAEGINKGLFTLNSPLRITKEARAMLEGLRPRLQKLYHELEPAQLTEHELGMEIEKRFGTDIVKEVCVPNNLNLMACILIAVGVAKGSDTLDTILDRTSGTLTL